MPVPSQLPPQTSTNSNLKWTIVFADEPAFRKFLKGFENECDDDLWITRELAKAASIFRTHEQVPGMFRPLGAGLFEIRLRRNPRVLIRLFFYLEPNNSLKIVWFYDKKKNSSTTYQNNQIKKAREKH